MAKRDLHEEWLAENLECDFCDLHFERRDLDTVSTAGGVVVVCCDCRAVGTRWLFREWDDSESVVEIAELDSGRVLMRYEEDGVAHRVTEEYFFSRALCPSVAA